MQTPLSLAAVLACATGCQTIFGLDDPLPRDERKCWGSEFEICLPAPASAAGARTLAGALDTSTSPECEPAILAQCVIAADAITIAALDVSGGRPLVVIGADSIIIEDRLDAASHAGPTGKVGPAGLGASCNAFAAAPTPRGGGAGGTLAGIGGIGGRSKQEASTLGGRPAPIVAINGLRAGCPGQDGGLAATNGGFGGGGGGAAYLIAGRMLEVGAGAMLNASGAGGAGAKCIGPCDPEMMGTAGGGGGGGTGGMLILEAPAIASEGFVIADGGGGGEGASQSNSGVTGGDPDGKTSALGGTGGAKHGGDGGAGSYVGVVTGSAGGDGDSSLSTAGGGGGGGAGVIRIYGAGTIGGGTVSPAPEVR